MPNEPVERPTLVDSLRDLVVSLGACETIVERIGPTKPPSVASPTLDGAGSIVLLEEAHACTKRLYGNLEEIEQLLGRL